MKTFKQKPITVLGDVKKIGDVMPNFIAIDNNLDERNLSEYQTPFVILNVVPSLDTGVCSVQTRRINEKLASYDKATVITISNDLPFAQKRYCGAEGLDIVTLSDHKYLDFAYKAGVLIEDLRLLARSVFVLNDRREIIYLEYLDEMSNHPNYDALFEFLETTL